MKKFFEKTGITYCLSALTLFLIGLGLSSCTPLRTTFWNIPSQKDYKKFPKEIVQREGVVYPLVESCHTGIPPIEDWGISRPYKPGMTVEELFRKTKTMAFLVLRGDTLLYEYYDKQHEPGSIFTSFSLVKIYVSTLVGIAIEEGYIDSLEQKASDFLPELKKEGLEKITIKDLLEMTSGIKSSESLLNPFGTSVRMYYTRKLERVIRNPELKTAPGAKYKYQNINTQLLSRILTQRTGMSPAKYLQKKIWGPLGMESDASWSLDHPDGETKAFCCFNAVARDFARFGAMMADSGRWKGEQIVPKTWLNEIFKPHNDGIYLPRYRLHWYTSAENEDWYGEGLMGQMTYFCPSNKMVIVRLGNGFQLGTKWYSMFKFLGGLENKPQIQSLPKDSLQKFTGNFVFGASDSNDSSMVGEPVRIEARKKGLKIITELYPPFIAYPSFHNEFYNVRNARRLNFYKDETGAFIRMKWYRRGVSWELDRVERKVESGKKGKRK